MFIRMLRVLGRRWRLSVTASTVVLALIAALLVGVKAIPGFSSPAAPAGTPVPVHVVAGQRVKVPVMRPSHRQAPSWPAARTATVKLTARSGPSRAGAGPSAGSAQAGTLPVWVGQPDAAQAPGSAKKKTAAGPAVSRASVGVESRKAAKTLGVKGLVLTVSRADGVWAAGAVHVAVSYKRFAQAYGGSYGSRLRLVELPACALTEPMVKACRTQIPLGSLNNARGDWAGANVTLPGAVSTTSALPGREAQPAVLTAAARSTSVVLAVVPSASGSAGNFAAEPLSEASLSWVAGPSSGAYTASYPITVPPVPGSLEPTVALNYNSQATSGLTSSTNNEASWVGDGFDYSPGFIETDYTTCSQDVGEPSTGDLCPDKDQVDLSLNGVVTPLVNSGGKWVAEADGGETIKQSGTTFEVIEPNGTQYWFGLNQLPGFASGDATTNSLWTVPVWEGCGTAAFCNQPWRYNLDYVVDPHGDAMAYFYSPQTNSYAEQNGATANATYTQGGVLSKIEYGFRAGQFYTSTPAAQVTFTSAAGRPDAPTDLACTSGTACAVTSPTFWNNDSLTTIATQAIEGGTLTNADSYALTTSYPATGDPTTSPSLWLASVTRTGQDGGTAITLPSTTFAGTPLPNRVQTAADTTAGYSQLTRFYLTSSTSATGMTTSIRYTSPNPAPCAAGTFPAPSANATACYPDNWTPPGATASTLDWFNQYAVTGTTATDTTAGDPPVVTSYAYSNPAWHYDSGTISRSAPVTYDQWRGFGQVTTEVGTAPDPVSETVGTYMQGMSQNGPPTSTGPTVSITTSRGQVVTDFNQFAGRPLELITYNGAGSSQQVTDAVNLPWTSTAVAVNTALNQSAFLTGTASALTYTALGGTGSRLSTDNYTYNANGLQASDSSIPDSTVAAEDTCTTTTYAANTATGLINLVATSAVNTAPCNASGVATGSLVSETENFYDGQGLGIGATAGNLTKVEKATATATFDTSTSTYDQYGRVLTATDPDGHVTTTAYTPATGAEPTSVSVTDPMGLATATSYDPLRDLALTATTPGGYQTVKAYDALGRVTSEWDPGSPTSGPATNTYSYAASNTAPGVTTQQVREPGGNYLTTQTLTDSFGNTREVQQETASGGTDVSDTTYNSIGMIDRTSSPYFVAGVPSGTLVVAASSSVPSQTGYVYDGDGRIIKQISYKLGTQTWESDSTYGGNFTTVVPPSGGTSQTTITDGRGLTTAVYQYHSGVPADPSDPAADYDQTSYTYTAAQKLASITDAAGNKWAFTYDLLGQQLTETTPDGGTTTTSWDPAGKQMSVTDGRGKTTSYTYDADNRKTASYDTTGGAAESAADELASWTYDSLVPGQLTSSTSFSGGAQYTSSITGYNSQGLPSGTSTVIPAAAGALAGTYTQQDTYAPNGAQTSYTDAAAGGLPAETVTTGYDNAGNPNSLTGATSYVDSVSYTNLGQAQEYTMGTASSPVYITDSYDPQTGQLTEQNTQTGAGQTSVDDLHYAYDNFGNVTSEADTPAGASTATDVQCFQNDYLGRLVQAWAQGSTGCAATPSAAAEGGAAPYWNRYSYDVTGNLTGITTTTPGGAVSTTASTFPLAGATAPHAISSQTVTSPSGTTTSTYAHDQAGNLTSVTGTGQNQAYTWNDAGQLSKDAVTPAGGGTAQNSNYAYDAGGNLLLESDPGTTTLYLDDEELSLNTGTGVVSGTRYYDLGTTSVATRTGASNVAYLCGDSQGTDSVSVDASTLAVTRRYFDPYGNPRGTAPSSFPTGQQGFVGGTNDAATGLTNLGAREYQPTLGAFLSTDPILDPTAPQDLNPYSYAKGNPATSSDPTGATATSVGTVSPEVLCPVVATSSVVAGGCGSRFHDVRTGCTANNITAFHSCVTVNSNSNGRVTPADVKHCSIWNLPCQALAIAAGGVAGGICVAILGAFGAVCTGVASGAYSMVTYLLGGNHPTTAKEALIQFAEGFAVGAVSEAFIAGVLKVAGKLMNAFHIFPSMAARLLKVADQLSHGGSHAKKTLLSWINHVL